MGGIPTRARRCGCGRLSRFARSSQKLCRSGLKLRGNPNDQVQRRIAYPSFDPGNVGPIDPGFQAELFLRHAGSEPPFAYVIPQDFTIVAHWNMSVECRLIVYGLSVTF